MRRVSYTRLAALAAAGAASLLLASIALAAESTFLVDPGRGNSALTAVFDATLGERITAVSSAIDCTIDVDEEALVGKARCTVPLASIRVDNDDTKSEHFAQWATNRKSDPTACVFTLEISQVALAPPIEPKKPVPFASAGKFTICGRSRDDGGSEQVRGTVTYLPAGAYGPARTLRVRARIEGFDRERYGISPAQTAGWLARVQQLADVVASVGTIEVNAFATERTSDERGEAE